MARVILVADDSPIIQRKAQKILQDEGFEVETVSNGVAAVKKLPALRPVLVLADVSMPGKDGYEVCEFVKTSEDLLQIPVLLVGSDLEPYDEPRGAQVKADGIIKKPFTPQDLITLVRKFTGPGEAPASQPALADTLVASPPEPRLAEPPEEVHRGPSEPYGAAAEPFPGFALGITPRPTLEPFPETAPEPTLVSSELISETASEVLPEPGPVFPELIPEPIPEAAPEPVLVSPESSREVEESRSREVEESRSREVEESRSREVEASKPREVEGLISTPQLPDSSTSPETVTESHPEIAGPTLEPIPEAAPEPVLASPESSREVEESRSREVEGLISTPQLLDSSTSRLPDSSTPPDPEWIHQVVLKVVTKMAPPVLAPQQVEELVRILTREITAELNEASNSSA